MAWRRLCFLGACCLLVTALLASSVFARAGGVLVTPARLDTTLPADGILPPIFVENRGSESVAYQAYLGWGSHDVLGRPIYSLTTSRSDVVVHVSPESGYIRPGERVALQVSVQPTEQAVYPVLFIALTRDDPTSRAVTRIAVPILVRPDGAEARGRFEAAWLETGESDALFVLNAVVANDGNAHIQTGGKFQVRDTVGNVVGEVKLPEHYVLPGARRRISASWVGDHLAAGEYSLHLATQLAQGNDSPLRFAIGHDRRLHVIDDEPFTLLAQGEVQP